MTGERQALRRHEDPLDAAAAARLSGWLRDYRPLHGIPDELIGKDGRPREYWLDYLGGLAEFAPGEFENRFNLATRHIRDTGVSYRIYGEETERSWPLSPLPLILGEAEWAEIAAGVEQRATLLEAVLRDLYGEARLVADGDLPAAAVTGGADFIRALRGVAPPGGRYMHLYAADLGRGPDGRWWLLGDRTQAPSGAGYALENRLVLSRAYPDLYNAMNVRRLAPFFNDFRDGLAGAASRSDPRICLLTPGPFSETYFEQAHLARYLGFLLVQGDDLVVRDRQVYLRTIDGLKRADVLWRRVDADFIDPLELNNASRLGVPGLLEAIRAGGVVVSNLPGSGLVESPALLGFLPALCRKLLGESLKLPNVATWWCGQPAERALVGRNIDELAIAGAFTVQGRGLASSGPRLLADLGSAEREALIAALHERPVDFVGQEVVSLSTTPVWRNGRLEPSPFVLRVYAAATKDGWRIMPGGFCRTSDRMDARAIFMGEGARTADVWVLADGPVERVSLMVERDDIKVRRILGHLPSRAADNLFWLGRYLERAEATLRLVRSLCTSLMDSEAALHGSGETLERLQGLLIAWGAVDEDALGGGAAAAASATLFDEDAYGSVISLVRAARRTAASMRERLSADFWTLLVDLENRLGGHGGELTSEAAALEAAEQALQALAGLSGLAQENMNRVAGWRFFDMGRRIERGINACRFMRQFADGDATTDDLDLLLDLADSQITYRARYLVGVALTPVRDLIMLDPYNPRSLAFQIVALKDHMAALPTLVEDGMLEPPGRLLVRLSSEIETEDASRLSTRKALEFEQRLLQLSDAVAVRYFLQGPGALPHQETQRAGVIYNLRHRTTYRYSQPVSFARCVLRLSPRETAAQTVLESVITVTPRPAHTRTHIGPFGERVMTVSVETDHTELTIEARSRVEVNRPSPSLPLDGPSWEAVREQAFASAALGPEAPAHFLYPTTATPVLAPITAYGLESFAPDRPIIEAAADLMGRIKRAFVYDPEATGVSTPVIAAFEARRGVCQDFTHIMIAALRGIGLPAAYVTGYLRTIPPPGKPRLEGADATHAWVWLWCGEALGWMGFDPTNDVVVAGDHIMLAVGRDSADTAPIDGVILGAGEQKLKVAVDVVPA